MTEKDIFRGGVEVVDEFAVVCNGGNEVLGHPLQYMTLERELKIVCLYCGRCYVHSSYTRPVSPSDGSPAIVKEPSPLAGGFKERRGCFRKLVQSNHTATTNDRGSQMAWHQHVQGVQASVAILAIVAAGVWFVNSREPYHKVKISHQVNSISLTDDKSLISTFVIVSNKGPRLVDINQGNIRLDQIVPLANCKPSKSTILCPKDEIMKGSYPIMEDRMTAAWPELGNKDIKLEKYKDLPEPGILIEPGEEYIIHAEFIVNADVRVVQLYSFFVNTELNLGDNAGWRHKSVHDVTQQRTTDEEESAGEVTNDTYFHQPHPAGVRGGTGDNRAATGGRNTSQSGRAIIAP